MSGNISKEKIGNRNPIDVANYILKKGAELGKQFTPMQIIKLVYIAHGWFMAFYNDDAKKIVPLINGHVEAWKYGPVIPRLYRAVKQFKASPIESPIPGGSAGENDLSETEKEVIDIIVNDYSDMDGSQLSNLTHKAGTPWANVKEEIPYEIIPNRDIFDHYKKKLDA